MENNELRIGRRCVAKAQATRDQLRMVVKERLPWFKAVVAASNEDIVALVEEDPNLFRFMANALIHEASLAALQNTVDAVVNDIPDD